MTPLPLVRDSQLPKPENYADTGCDLAPSCLRCPFERCRYDEPKGTKIRVREKHRRIEAMYAAGYEPREIAAAAGISRRQVERVLARERR